jgi:hypothetical protein
MIIGDPFQVGRLWKKLASRVRMALSWRAQLAAGRLADR